MNLVDPDGNSTWVFQFAEGHYMVTDKGNPHDGDNNVYVGYFDSEGEWNETSEVLGQTLTPYSFFNSDSNKWEEWAIIDLSDISGEMMMAYLETSDISIFYYINNARSGKIFDFKMTNGIDPETISGIIDPNRGMKLYVNGQSYIASARDIGNFAAGYMARKKGLPYWMARVGFDGYQSFQSTLKANYNNNVYYGYYEPTMVIDIEGVY